MSEDGQNDDKALFAQYCAARREAAKALSDEDSLLLAAWVEHRLDETEAAAIETMLALDPVLLDDAFAVLHPIEREAVSDELVTRLQALVPADRPASGFNEKGAATIASTATVLAYAPRPQRVGNRAGNHVNRWLSWSAIAASLLLVSAAGLGVGVTAGQHLTQTGETSNYSLMDALDTTSWVSDEVG